MPMVVPFQVPVAIVPRVVRLVLPANGLAPIVLYETVVAVAPLNDVPEDAPVPLLLNVKLFGISAVIVVEPPKLTELPLIVILE